MTESLLSLDDLPLELLAHIAHALVQPADVAHLQACSRRLNAAHALDRTVANYLGCVKGRCGRLLASGAPLGVVQSVFARWGKAPASGSLRHAVQGGRCDVVRWVVDTVVAAGRAEHADPSKTWTDKQLRAAARHYFFCASLSGSHDIMRFLRGLFGTSDEDVARGEREMRYAGNEAASRGDLDTFALVHDMLVGAAPRRLKCLGHRRDCACTEVKVRAPDDDTAQTCGCSQNAAAWAFANGHLHIVEWMRSVGCCGHYPRRTICPQALYHAVTYCPPETFWYLAAAQPAPSPLAFTRAINAAAAKGRVDMVIHIHQKGLAQCGIDTLIAAAKSDHVALLQWAAGQPDATDRPPIDAWRPTILAWHAAKHGSIKVIDWFLARPDARLCVTIASVEAALRAGHVKVALAAHKSGVVRLDQWSALDAAAASGILRAVREMADHGAACTVSTFVAAIKRASKPWGDKPFVYLCERYGTTLVQDAVDRIRPDKLTPNVVGLIRENAPGVRLPDDLP